MKNKTFLALIGAGGIGKLWAKEIKKNKSAVLATVADLDRQRAADIAGNFQNCSVETDWKTILKNKNIEAVIIATPHKFLAPISLAMLKASKHVLCEKPAGINSREIQKNILASERNDLVYTVGFNHRYHPAFALAKTLFDRGEIGKFLFIRARYGFGGRPGYEKEWRLDKKIGGGGELLDQGVHMIDMIRWFMGDFGEIKGFAPKLFWKNGVEDNGFVLLRGQNGGVASIHVSWTNWNWIHSFEIFGDKGYLIIDGLDQRYRGPERLTIGKRDPEFLKPPSEKVTVFKSEGKSSSLGRELREFLNAIHGKKNTIPTGRDAEAVLKVVEAVYRQDQNEEK